MQALVARIAAINTLIIEHEGGNEFHRYYIYWYSNLLVVLCTISSQKFSPPHFLTGPLQTLITLQPHTYVL
jgi:hypothetical protein